MVWVRKGLHVLLLGALSIGSDCGSATGLDGNGSGPAFDASGQWDFATSVSSDALAEWLLDLRMDSSGDIDGTAPVGRVTIFLPGVGGSTDILRDNRPVHGSVSGNSIELRFDAWDGGDQSAFTGSLKSDGSIAGSAWFANRR